MARATATRRRATGDVQDAIQRALGEVGEALGRPVLGIVTKTGSWRLMTAQGDYYIERQEGGKEHGKKA